MKNQNIFKWKQKFLTYTTEIFRGALLNLFGLSKLFRQLTIRLRQNVKKTHKKTWFISFDVKVGKILRTNESHESSKE